jgi:hypothetical protein
MLPKIQARFRKRQGVPYAIEQLSGRQFRCRHCNQVFFEEKDLDRHIQHILNQERVHSLKVSAAVPELSNSIEVRLLYTYDLMDKMKKKWLRLKRGDMYDGI